MTSSVEITIVAMNLAFEQDVVFARQRARQIAALLSFDPQTQTRIATAVSEIARNALLYAQGGQVEYYIQQADTQALKIKISDDGPGIANLSAILEGRYRSTSGLGIGIVGAKRLMDGCTIQSSAGSGTTIILSQNLPPSAKRVNAEILAKLQADLALVTPRSAFDVVRSENLELVKAIEALKDREVELARLNRELEATHASIFNLYNELDEKAASLEEANRELEETNRGIIALYSELDDKAMWLQQASELKSRFLSYVSHEFRTPLHSILSLSRLMSQDGNNLTPDQEKQLSFIRASATELVGLCNDVLETAKVEAGKIEIKAEHFYISDLLASLRGMLKPLAQAKSDVEFSIDDPDGMPSMHSDQVKIAQILRNFISNALKFTTAGKVHLTTQVQDDYVIFAVSDTGIGISREDQSRLFEEFSQIDGPHQKNITGSGLGLSVARHFAQLLGGEVSVSSERGRGSTFTVRLPCIYKEVQSKLGAVKLDSPQPPLKARHSRRALIIDDHEVSRYLLADLLAEDSIDTIEAASGTIGLERALTDKPDIIFLDLVMPELDGFAVLRRLKEEPETANIPVVIHSSKVLSEEEVKNLSRLTRSIIIKEGTSRPAALARVQQVLDHLNLRDHRE